MTDYRTSLLYQCWVSSWVYQHPVFWIRWTEVVWCSYDEYIRDLMNFFSRRIKSIRRGIFFYRTRTLWNVFHWLWITSYVSFVQLPFYSSSHPSLLPKFLSFWFQWCMLKSPHPPRRSPTLSVTTEVRSINPDTFKMIPPHILPYMRVNPSGLNIRVVIIKALSFRAFRSEIRVSGSLNFSSSRLSRQKMVKWIRN